MVRRAVCAGSRPRQPPEWRLRRLLLVLVTCRHTVQCSSAPVLQCSHVGAEDDADMGTITTTIYNYLRLIYAPTFILLPRAGVDIAAALDTMRDKGLCIM